MLMSGTTPPFKHCLDAAAPCGLSVEATPLHISQHAHEHGLHEKSENLPHSCKSSLV
jgi:hypothetical protein